MTAVQARLSVELLEDRRLLSDFTLGPLVQVSGASPFVDCTDDKGQPGRYYLHSEVEPYLAVDPTNPDHIVGTWQQDRWDTGSARGLMAGASFDGGATWQSGVIPGLSVCSGDSIDGRASDPWLAFAANGDLYLSSGAGRPDRNSVRVNKSTDGGLTWSAPVTLIEDTEPGVFNDKESITADPMNPNFVYAVWVRITSRGTPDQRNPTWFARSTDGGQTWEPAREILGGNIRANGNWIVVLPDGTLVNSFGLLDRDTGVLTVSLIRSSDRGQTWSEPIHISEVQRALVTDPDTGDPVQTATLANVVLHSVAVDPHSGNLYAVWEDGRFLKDGGSSVAFSMSTDGGLTWSEPIKVNQTPDDIAPGNQQAFIPAISVAADGTVTVTYYDFRLNDPEPGLPTDVWVVHGHADSPGGLTDPANWGGELRLTDASFDMEQAPIVVRGGFFVGDYEGLAAVGNSFVAFFAQPHDKDPASIFFRRIEAPGRGHPGYGHHYGHGHHQPDSPSQAADALAPVTAGGEHFAHWPDVVAVVAVSAEPHRFLAAAALPPNATGLFVAFGQSQLDAAPRPESWVPAELASSRAVEHVFGDLARGGFEDVALGGPALVEPWAQ